ncbi:asialoglycoprotein receptor 1 [Enoplosus armatus]|uniref:asialoglycoprotein receptor 1 n=1 Tax=Enoplosus armatus TaxID=215367 RepID=UPI003993BDCF
MAEEEVNYASVVFKANNPSPPEAEKVEETVYDEVKVRGETTEQTADTNVSAGSLPDKQANCSRRYQQLTFCLGTLCVILLLVIITVCVYFASHESEQDQLKESQANLLVVNRNLTNLNENLRNDVNSLTVQNDNLTQNNTALKSEISDLTAQNQQLEEQIRNSETKWNQFNVTRAQWSIDAYCPKDENKGNERQCKACQNGWIHNQTSCYVIHDPKPLKYQKTWKEAREDCRKTSSDLVLITNLKQKAFISEHSWCSSGTKGYWIGLIAEDGKWKWLDGSDLSENWIEERPADGQCAISVLEEGWKSVSCDVKQRWICVNNALSV